MLLHFCHCRGILKPLLSDTVDTVQAIRDGNLRVDKRVNQNATVLIHNANLAYNSLAVTLFHLTIHSYEQCYLCLFCVIGVVFFIWTTEKLQLILILFLIFNLPIVAYSLKLASASELSVRVEYLLLLHLSI